MFCSTRTMASPRARLIEAIFASISWTMLGWMPSDGSSSSSTLGPPTRALPRASICCSPPDSVSPRCRYRSRRRGNSSRTSSSRARPFARFRSAPISRCSSTLRPAKIMRPWGTYPRPRRARSCAGNRDRSSPSRRIVPDVTRRSPMIAFRSVVLPTPLRPMMETISPASTRRLGPIRAGVLPYSTWMSATDSIVDPLAQVDVADALVALDLLHRALGEDLALMHDRHPARDHPDEVHVVLDHDDRGRLVEPPEEPDRLLHLFHRHAGRRLVEQDQGRLADAGHADLEPLLHAVGEPRGGMVGPLGQTDDLQHLGRPPPTAAIAEAEFRGDVQVLEHAQLHEDARHLELDAHPEPRNPERVPSRDVPAPEAHRPRVGAHAAAEDPEERRLAGTVGADQAAQLTRVDGQVEVDRSQSAELLRQAAHLEDRLRHVVLSSEQAEVSLLADDPVAEIDEDGGQEQPPPPAAVTGEDPEERRRDPVLEDEDDAHQDRALDEQRRPAHDAPARPPTGRDPRPG